MHPVLFEIPLFGGLRIYTYGVLVALGFLCGMWWVGREAKRLGEDPAKATDLVFYCIVSGLLGARLLYILVSNREQFFQDPLSFFRIWEGGLVFYGGVIGSLLAGLWYTHRHQLNFWRYLDIFAPGLALGHAVGRLGCLMAGCCYGRPAAMEGWWTIVFPSHVHGFAPAGIPLYPTQPMEAIGEFSIFLLLVLFRKWKRFDGQIYALYLLLYAVLRSVLEQFRGDTIRGFVLDGLLSTSQAISLGIVLLALMIWFVQGRKKATA